MPGTYAPERADVVWLSFDPPKGHERAGRRPAVVVSPRQYNEEVGLMVSGVVLSDQLKNLDLRTRKAEFICRLPHTAMAEILAKIHPLVV